MVGQVLGGRVRALSLALRGVTFAVFALAVLALAAVAGSPDPAAACGYHNRADIARGVMNLVFPNALYVRTAVWQAQRSGVLPKRRVKAGMDLFAYQRTASQLREFGRALSSEPDEELAFTVVLLEEMLWTRFVSGPDDYAVNVHVKGPERGDVVIVAEAEVIRALIEDALDVKTAERHGLIRFYGPVHRRSQVRSALAGLPGRAQDEPSKGTH